MTVRRLLVATRSVHKLRELRELLDLDRTELVSLDDLGIEGDPIESGETFETNAAIKARFGLRASGLPFCGSLHDELLSVQISVAARSVVPGQPMSIFWRGE